jgi:lipopolysaccharide/colanic/teichoic acid biosynthesis glycosyltransferase
MFYETRHVIKPGLTGWAQVNYAYGESIEDSLIKLQYVTLYKTQEFYLDLNIALKPLLRYYFIEGSSYFHLLLNLFLQYDLLLNYN